MPEVGVLIAARNEEMLLPDALASLVRQATDATYEIVVIDNASTDATADIAVHAGVGLHSCPDRGKLPCLRFGLACTSADVIAIADADTRYPPNWVDIIADHFRTRPNVALVFGPSDVGVSLRKLETVTTLMSSLFVRLSLTIGVACSLGFNMALRRTALTEALKGVGDSALSGWAIGTTVLRAAGRASVLYDPRLRVPKCMRRYAAQGLVPTTVMWMGEWLRLAVGRRMSVSEAQYYGF